MREHESRELRGALLRVKALERENHLLRACGVVVFLAFGAMMTMGQANPQNNLQETIRVGGEVGLGITEQSAFDRVSSAGYNVRRNEVPVGRAPLPGVTSTMVVESNAGQSLGVLFFSKGRLTHVLRFALPNDKGEGVEFGRQVFFMMREFETQGETNCHIETRTGEVPEYAFKRAYLHCGHKTLAVEIEQIRGQSESVQLNEELNQ